MCACNHYLYLGSATFIISAYLSHEWSNQTVRQNVQSHLVMGWAARLGLFLFARILRDGEDKRFVRAKQQPSVFFKFWTIQGKYINYKTNFFNLEIKKQVFFQWTIRFRFFVLLQVYGFLLRCFQH